MNNKQKLYISSKNEGDYPIHLNKEQLEAIPILVNMAMIYTWELYKKTQDDKFYEQHKENIDLIQEYHNKGYQGILAVGSIIESKCKYALENINIDEAVAPFLNKYEKEYNQESVDIEKTVEHLKLIDERFKQVSCTNCIHWDNLFNSMDNKNSITPRPCCTCFPYNPEDSVQKIKRLHYE